MPAWISLSFKAIVPVTVPAPGVLAQVDSDGVITACVRATGAPPVRKGSISLNFPLVPGTVPSEPFALQEPPQGIQLVAMRAVSSCSLPESAKHHNCIAAEALCPVWTVADTRRESGAATAHVRCRARWCNSGVATDPTQEPVGTRSTRRATGSAQGRSPFQLGAQPNAARTHDPGRRGARTSGHPDAAV